MEQFVYFPERLYLCRVFFIVLDFKVNKGWAQRSPFFMSVCMRFPFASMPESSIYIYL